MSVLQSVRYAVQFKDLEHVKRRVAGGADVKESDGAGYTPLLQAALRGHIPIMHWLLNEGGSSLAERTLHGESALLVAARKKRFPVVQWLLEEQGASINESRTDGSTVWTYLHSSVPPRGRAMQTGHDNTAELSSLLKVAVMLEDAPVDTIANLLRPQHAEICTRGRQLRAQLLSYLEQQRAAVVAHCNLPAVLQSLVTAYATTPPADMWTDGLRFEVPGAKRGRTKVNKENKGESEDALPIRRSLRLRQKRA
jgi:hypothetical protein